MEHSPLFTQISGDGATKKKKEKKKKEGQTCGGFEAVLLAVANWRMAWTMVGFASSSLHFFLLCSSLFMFSSFVSHGAVVDGKDGGNWR